MALRNVLAIQRQAALQNAGPVQVAQVEFTENGAGTYTGSVNLPPGAVLIDIIIHARALWAAATSATMIVGDAADDDGYYTAVNLKATDLLADESLSFAQQGGKAGAYNAGVNTHWLKRMSTAAKTITGKVTSVGAGTTGRTIMAVVYALPLGNIAQAKKS